MSADEASFDSIARSSGNGIVLDDRSFEIFFRENFVRFCVLCQYKFGFDTQLAKEVVHIAFIKLWEFRHKINDTRFLLPYFQRIVYNNCLDTLKHEKIRVRYRNTAIKDESFAIDENANTAIDARQLQSDISGAIAQLPPQMRTIFELSRFEGKKYAEISRQLDISLKTVETQMSRALVRLKKSLSAYLHMIIIIFLLSSPENIYFFHL
jgi:RNA polymerase sigma-70 factor (ECF subfamily)